MKKKLVAAFLSAAMAATMLAGCGANDSTAPTDSGSKTEDSSDARSAEEAGGDQVTIKLFSNLPDRKNGQGLVEQMIIDEYMEANKNVSIEVETLDEEVYKTKFKAYAMDGMPDVVSIWGQPAFLDEVLDAGVLAELNEADYADYGFLEGSLEGFKKDGKLYGLPRNTDVAVIYYNQKMFDDNGWAVPETYDDLLDLAGTIKDAGVIPMAMDGGDGWPMAVYLKDLMYKNSGDVAGPVSEAVANGDFSGKEFADATELLIEHRTGSFWICLRRTGRNFGSRKWKSVIA